MGLGGVENCGADQVFDPNIEYFGIKGQCMPRKNYTAAQLENPNAYPTTVKSGAAKPGAASSIIGALIGGLTQPKPAAPTYAAPAPSSGISTGTAVAIGAGALAILYFATR